MLFKFLDNQFLKFNNIPEEVPELRTTRRVNFIFAIQFKFSLH